MSGMVNTGIITTKAGYDYPTAFSLWGVEEDSAMDRVIASGQFTMAHETKAFEQEFAEHMGMKHAVMVNSGSSANLIAIAALLHAGKLKPRDKVIVPALAWATTYAPLVQHDLDLILADCDGTWCAKPTEQLLDNSVGEIGLIVDVPILGQPGWGQHWQRFARERRIPLMVDCCEAMGSWMGPYGTRTMTGTTGLVNTFSFFHSHQLSAIEGGMVLTDDDELADIMRMLRNHGLARPPSEAASFDEQYDFRLMGYNVRPLEIHAAIAREQLKKLDGFRRHREQALNNFAVWAYGLPIGLQMKVWGTVPSPFGIPFTVKTKEKRAELVTALKANSIDCRLPTGGSFRKHKYGEPWANQPTPEADRIHDTGLFLGLAPWDISDKIQRAVEVMRQVL